MYDIEEYVGTIYEVLAKYGIPKEEFFDIALEALHKAILKFDPDKTSCKPQTFFIYYVEYGIAAEIKKQAIWNGLVNTNDRRHPTWYLTHYRDVKNCTARYQSSDDFIEVNEIHYSEPLFRDAVKEIEVRDFYNSCLKENDIKICKLRIEGYTMDEIGKILGCSKQNVARVIERVKKKAIEYFGEYACSNRKMKRIKSVGGES